MAAASPLYWNLTSFISFASRELVRLPPEYCAEMVAFDASSGEVRTHYAGFFDSGFGYSEGPQCRCNRRCRCVGSAQPGRAVLN